MSPPTRQKSHNNLNRFNNEFINNEFIKANLKQKNMELPHSPERKKIPNNVYIESINRLKSPLSDVNEKNHKKIYKRFDTNSSNQKERSSEKKKVFLYEPKIPKMFDVQNKNLVDEISQLEDFKNKEIGSMIGEFKSHWSKINGYLFFMNERLYDIYVKAE